MYSGTKQGDGEELKEENKEHQEPNQITNEDTYEFKGGNKE